MSLCECNSINSLLLLFLFRTITRHTLHNKKILPKISLHTLHFCISSLLLILRLFHCSWIAKKRIISSPLCKHIATVLCFSLTQSKTFKSYTTDCVHACQSCVIETSLFVSHLFSDWFEFWEFTNYLALRSYNHHRILSLWLECVECEGESFV